MAIRKCRECGGTVSSKAAACPSCGAPVKKQTSIIRTGCGCLLIIISGAAMVAFLAKGNLPQPNGAEAPHSESQTPRAGDGVVITTEMWLSVDESTHKESLKLVTANDEVGLEQMERQGRIFVVPAGTTAVLLEGGLFTSRVRIRSGQHSGKAGYITSDFVQKQ